VVIDRSADPANHGRTDLDEQLSPGEPAAEEIVPLFSGSMSPFITTRKGDILLFRGAVVPEKSRGFFSFLLLPLH
jgi:hypothetical protein